MSSLIFSISSRSGNTFLFLSGKKVNGSPDQGPSPDAVAREKELRMKLEGRKRARSDSASRETGREGKKLKATR
jgi:hypothetical protein